MENRIVTAVFGDSNTAKVSDVWQWDYGQVLRIQGLDLPTAVEVDFAVSGANESIARIGTTKDGVTDVTIPDSLIETGKNLVAYIYLRDSESGNTEYQIDMFVTKRAKPEAYNTPDDKEMFGKAIEAVNKAADRAEKAGQTATEAAGQAAEDAQKTAEDRKEVAKMVETVSDISEQVKKVEQLSQKAQEAATKTEADAQQTAEDRVEVGKMLETVKDASEQVKNVEESVRKAKESEQAAARHRTAVEEMKNSVEQTASTFPQTVQSGIQAVENAGASEVQEITQAGTSQKAAVEAAGTQAVESVENVKASATEAVETVKTEAIQAVQEEGTTQTGNVTTEGAKQVKAVQDKGNEVLQSIPEDFQMQMESKLDKQQGVENKGKALVIGEDGNVAPGEVQSGGGDGIAIINTMSGESPLVISDSAERTLERLELGGNTEQVQTSGKNLFDPNNNYEDLVWIRNDGEIVGGSNARTSDYIPVEQGNYAFQFDVINYNQMFVAGYNTGKQFVKIVGTISKGKCIIKIDDIQIETIRLSYTRESTRIQLERSETQTPYEPYTGGKPSPSPEYPQEIKNSGKWNEEKQKYEVDVKITNAEQNWSKEQTLTITSDRPITKWDRLVEQGGEIGWLYKSKTATITGKEHYSAPSESYYSGTSTNMYTVDFGLFIKGGEYCNRLQRIDGIWDSSNINNIGFTTNGSNQIHIRIYNSLLNVSDNATKEEKVAAFKTYLMKEYENGNPYIVIFQTKDTEFIPLPQSEQNAIRALKTYYPTTVITADGGELDPDIKVTYVADTKLYIDNKVSANVASIISQYQLNTANLLSLMPMETQATMIENDTNNILNNLESEEAHE